MTEIPKSVLITGGTGTFGRAFARQLLEHHDVERICIFSRDEHKQAVMRAELGNDSRLRWFVGDVRDLSRLTQAMAGCELVVHAAALKRIEVGHYNPTEMVKTNIGGSMNVIDASAAARVARVIALSTDKAYQPISPYGQTKALAETMFLNANNMHGEHGPRYAATRYGNIWNANGSVLPKWQALIKAGATTVPVTDPSCTRFFMRVEEAVLLVTKTAQAMAGGELVIPQLPAYRIGALAQALGVEMEVTGLPPWEKKHEAMGDGMWSNDAPMMTIEQLKEEIANANMHG